MAKNKKKNDNMQDRTPAYRNEEDGLDFLPDQPLPVEDNDSLEKELQALFNMQDVDMSEDNSEAALLAEELLKEMKNGDSNSLSEDLSENIQIRIVSKSSKKNEQNTAPVKESAPVKEGSSRHMIRLVVVLTAICAAVAGMLAVVNHVTKDTIAENARKAKEAAVLTVFPEGDSCREYVTSDGTTVYFAADGEYVIGYCVNVTPSGYSGEINMMVGIDSEGEVSGIKIVSLSETPGVGTKVMGDSFLSQFLGRSGDETLEIGKNIDGIGGATFSSKAVVSGVNEALAVSFDLESAAAEVGLKLSSGQVIPAETEDSNDDNGDETLMPGEAGEITETESAETKPAETAPIESGVETDAPDTETAVTAPVETVPAETESWIPKPVETEALEETELVETIPVETEAAETTPAETEAAETTPVETAPAETEAPETEVIETAPAETDAIETAPAETEAVETLPVETEPVETGSAVGTPDEPEIVMVKYSLGMRMVDIEGNLISDQLDGDLNNSFWISNADVFEYDVKIGRNVIGSWKSVPYGYYTPDEIVFMVWPDGMITTDNNDVDVENYGSTVIFVITMETDPSAAETEDETEEEVKEE